MMSVDAPMMSPAHQTTTESPQMPDPNAGLPPRYLRTAEAARFLSLSPRTLEKHRILARVLSIAKSAPASSTRFQISTRGPISAPKPPPATPASARCCRQSGALLSLMQEKSGADP